jgi:hypothetical protein
MDAAKTKPTKAGVNAFLARIRDRVRQEDCAAVLKMMKAATKEEPRMWGASIVGCGHYHYKYASGREGDMFLTGLASRKKDLTLYLGNVEGHADLLKGLGKHKVGGGCLYIRALADIDGKVLERLIKACVKARRANIAKERGA